MAEPRTKVRGIERDQQILVSFRSDDETAREVKDFLDKLANGLVRAWMENPHRECPE